jgi:hypothetical protein
MTALLQTQSSQIAVIFRRPQHESREMVAKLFWIGMDEEAVALAQTMKQVVIGVSRDTD